MKTIYTLLATAAISTTASATVLVVNNALPSPGQFSTVAAAVTAASASDTLYITGSLFNYGSFTLNKSLTIIGTGHKPQNTNTATSKVDNITLSSNSGGSKIIGLDVNYISTATSMDNISISRCKVRDQIAMNNNHNNWLIEGNYFESTSINISNYTYSYNTFFVIKSNVFNGQLTSFYNVGAYNSYVIVNNIFLKNGQIFTGDAGRYLTIVNNIFYNAQPSVSVQYSTFSKNISFGGSNPSFGAGTGNSLNLNITDTDPLFVSASVGPYDYNNDYQLQATSPGHNYGTDGTDLGVYGGDGFFQKYGIPAIPQIRDFSIVTPADHTVAPGGTLQVKVISTIKR